MTEREILDSWKEIADYLRRDVRTCQRYERELGLPVHRLDGSARARAFAYRDEIDDWRANAAKGTSAVSLEDHPAWSPDGSSASRGKSCALTSGSPISSPLRASESARISVGPGA